MSQVILVTTRGMELTDLLGSSGLSVQVIAPTDLGPLARQDKVPSVVLVDLRGSKQLPVELVEFRSLHPDVGVAIIVSSLEPQLMLEAMRAGCTECLTEPLSARELEEAVRKLLTTSAAPGLRSPVLAFVGAKGGVGTTTLAVNTAVALQEAKMGPVLLMDTHIGSGEAALFLGAEPRFSILDALENAHRLDASFFGSLVEKTKSGVHLLASSTDPLRAHPEGDRLRALFEAVARTYKTTVVDVPRMDSTVLDALDSVTMVVVVTGQDIASLRNAAQMTPILRRRYGSAQVKVAINRFSADAVIELADIERTIGSQVDYRIPGDYAMAVEALNTGRPFMLNESRLAVVVRRMAMDLAGRPPQQPSSSSGGV